MHCRTTPARALTRNLTRLLILLPPLPAGAQTVGDASAGPGPESILEEVVVTAERRRADLMSSSLAASVLTDADIATFTLTATLTALFPFPRSSAPRWRARSRNVRRGWQGETVKTKRSNATNNLEAQ